MSDFDPNKMDALSNKDKLESTIQDMLDDRLVGGANLTVDQYLVAMSRAVQNLKPIIKNDKDYDPTVSASVVAAQAFITYTATLGLMVKDKAAATHMILSHLREAFELTIAAYETRGHILSEGTKD